MMTEFQIRKINSRSFICFQPEIIEYSFELDMIRSCMKDDVFLPVQILEGENMMNEIRFDISEKSSLQSICQFNGIDTPLMVCLLKSLQRAILCLSEYLLGEDTLILHPDLIYYDKIFHTFRFCYIPGNYFDIKTEMLGLLEYLMAHYDYKNSDLSGILYQIDSSLQEDNPSVYSVMKCVKIDLPKEGAGNYEMPEEINFTVQSVPDNTAKNGKKRYFDIAGSKVREFVGKYKKRGKEICDEIRKHSDLHDEERKKEEGLRNRKENKLVCENNFEETICLESEDTMLLKENKVKSGTGAYAKMISRVEGNGNILICSDRCCIGKWKEYVDAFIPDSSVSRVHMEIRYFENGWEAIDFNSTNGSFLNGEKMKPYHCIRIKSGDVLKIANSSYTFEEMVCPYA